MNKLNVIEVRLGNSKGLSFTCGKLYVRITVDGLTLRVETNLPVRARELAETEAATHVRRSVFDRADELRRGARHSDGCASTARRRVIRRRT